MAERKRFEPLWSDHKRFSRRWRIVPYKFPDSLQNPLKSTISRTLSGIFRNFARKMRDSRKDNTKTDTTLQMICFRKKSHLLTHYLMRTSIIHLSECSHLHLHITQMSSQTLSEIHERKTKNDKRRKNRWSWKNVQKLPRDAKSYKGQ